MKRVFLFTVLCTLILPPARGWSYRYWHCPVSWSDARVYFQIGFKKSTDGNSVLYVAGEGSLPDSNGDNTAYLYFEYAHGHLPSSRLPWRSGGDLANIVFDLGLTYSVINIHSISVDEGITHIGNWWFEGLSRVNEAYLPLTLQSIGEGAFKGCGRLPEMYCFDNVKTIGSRAFADCGSLKNFKIPAGSTLGDEVFRGSGLESVELGNNVKFGSNAFQDCKNFKQFTVPANYTLSDNIFSGSLLETVSVNDNVNFGKQSFYNCKNLKSITFRGRINEVPEGMFRACSSLQSVNIPDGVTAVGNSAFEDCSGLQSVNIPNSVTSVGDYAFQGCSSLQTVNIPVSVTSIGNSVFASCSNLQTVHIPGSITSIGDCAFQNCASLTGISLPAAVAYLGKNVFQGSGIKSIDAGAPTPPSVNDETFAGLDFDNVYICVPSKSVDAYRAAAGWKNFKNIGAYPAGIRLDKHSVTARGNTALKLNAYLMPYNTVQDVRWHTKNINVAEVNNGTVRFKAPGTAAIVATTHNGMFSDSCFIRVSEGNFDGRPTFVDSLFGEWVQCDENLQVLPNPERLEFWKTVNTSPEGYQTVLYEAINSYPGAFHPGTFTFNVTDRTLHLSLGRWYAYVLVLEITENTLKVLDITISYHYEYLFVRTK